MAKKHTAPPAATDEATNTPSESGSDPAPDQTQEQAGAGQDPAQPDGDHIADAGKVVAPGKLVLAAPYGFIDDDGERHYWHAGTEVANPDEIAVLIERGAPVQEA